MINSPFELPQEDNNPISTFEEIVNEQDWAVDPRSSENSLTFSVKGKVASYTIHMEWQEEFAALLFACVIEMEVAEKHKTHAAEVLARLNESLWLGHFDFLSDGAFVGVDAGAGTRSRHPRLLGLCRHCATPCYYAVFRHRYQQS